MPVDIEKKRARARKYYHKNKDKVLEKKKEYFKKPEIKAKMREYMKNYYRKLRNKKKNDYEESTTPRFRMVLPASRSQARSSQPQVLSVCFPF